MKVGKPSEYPHLAYATRLPDQAPIHARSMSLVMGEFWRDTDDIPKRDTYRVHGFYRFAPHKRLLLERISIEPSPWVFEKSEFRERRNDELPNVDLFDSAVAIDLESCLDDVREYLEDLPRRIREFLQGSPDLDESIRIVEHLTVPATKARRGPGRKGHSDSDFAAMARNCLEEARNEKRGHRRRLAAKWKVSEQRAKERIIELRKNGWLGPGQLGRFEAKPGPNLIEWLREASKEDQ